MMEPHVARRRGLWLMRASPWASFIVVTISVIVSAFAGYWPGFLALIAGSSVLLFVPDRIGWWLLCTPDPEMPDGVAQSAHEFRFMMRWCWAVEACMVVSLVGWLFSPHEFWEVALWIIAALVLVSGPARIGTTIDFVANTDRETGTTSIGRSLAYSYVAVAAGVVLFAVLAFARDNSAGTTTIALSGLMVLVVAGVAMVDWRTGVQLTRALSAGWGSGCANCGYDLSGLDATVCPECGAATETKQPASPSEIADVSSRSGNAAPTPR